MNSNKIRKGMGFIDEDLIAGAIEYTRTKKKNGWMKWAAMAACLALVISFAIPLTQITQDKLPTEDIQMIVYNNAYYEVCEEKSVLKRLGIKATINETDAGDIITYLEKKNPGGKSEYIATAEQTDIALYSYAPAPCEAVYVICDNGEYDAVVFCNYVLPDIEPVTLEMLYSTFAVKSDKDISSIAVVNDWFKKKVIGPTITDDNTIAEFYSYSITLKDYSNDDYHEINYGHIATEDELLQAYDQTNKNMLTIMIETTDGLRFCLEYDEVGGWIYSKDTLRYYRVTEEISKWFLGCK